MPFAELFARVFLTGLVFVWYYNEVDEIQNWNYTERRPYTEYEKVMEKIKKRQAKEARDAHVQAKCEAGRKIIEELKRARALFEARQREGVLKPGEAETISDQMYNAKRHLAMQRGLYPDLPGELRAVINDLEDEVQAFEDVVHA